MYKRIKPTKEECADGVFGTVENVDNGDAEKKDGYVFAGFWKPEEDYDDDHIIVPFRSVFDDMVDWDPGQIFSNVIGSLEDRLPSGQSWVHLYQANLIVHSSDVLPDDDIYCATDGFFYDPDTGEKFMKEDGACQGCSKYNPKTLDRLVGGHIIPSIHAGKVKKGYGVYITNMQTTQYQVV